MGKEPQAAEDPKRDQYKSKADIVAFVKKSFADGAAAIQSKGEKGMTTEVVYLPDQKARVLDIAYGLIEHSGEHYGQLVVYSVSYTHLDVYKRQSRWYSIRSVRTLIRSHGIAGRNSVSSRLVPTAQL